jgi:transcriptional regulator with XRE-family HTH domain
MNSEIIKRLIMIREALGLKQGIFAQTLGIPQTTLSTIEHGKSPLQERYIKLICLTFNVSENWLRTGEGEMFMPDSSKFEEEELFKFFCQLTPEMKNAILEHVKTLFHIQQTQQNPRVL